MLIPSYSRVSAFPLMKRRDESGTLARLRKNRSEHLNPVLTKYGGRLVKLTGDGAVVLLTGHGPAAPSSRNVRNCTSTLALLMYLCAMVPEGTPGKWSLWATHPKRLGGIAELYATIGAASGKAADLRQAGYVVEVFLSRSTCPQPSDARCLGSQAAPFDGPG